MYDLMALATYAALPACAYCGAVRVLHDPELCDACATVYDLIPVHKKDAEYGLPVATLGYLVVRRDG